MSSPVGHGLAAVAAGWLVARPPSSRRAAIIQSATLAAIGVMPDLDLLIGRHSAETHSIGAAAIVASVAAVARVPVAQTAARIWLAVFLAWMTHPLLDAFTADSSVPVGIMVWWPFSSAHYHSGIVRLRFDLSPMVAARVLRRTTDRSRRACELADPCAGRVTDVGRNAANRCRRADSRRRRSMTELRPGTCRTYKTRVPSFARAGLPRPFA